MDWVLDIRRRALICYSSLYRTVYCLTVDSPFKVLGKDGEKEISILFEPKSLICAHDYLVITGKQDFMVYSIKNNTQKLYPRQDREILDIHLHPLSSRSIGILYSNGFLTIYTVPNEEADISINLSILSPLRFTFFNERPKSLFAFGCCVLSSTKKLYIVSPVLPQSFRLNKEVLRFKQVFQIEGNSYMIFEKRLETWMAVIENSISQDTKNWKQVTVNNYSFDFPLPRGPCCELTGEVRGLSVVRDSNPSVLAVITKKDVKMLVATGDLVPSFSEGRASLKWELIEEIELEVSKVLYSSEYFLCQSSSQIVKIDFPWLPVLVESYSTMQPVRSIQKSVVSVVEENLLVFDFAYIQHSHSFCVVSQNKARFLNAFSQERELSCVKTCDFLTENPGLDLESIKCKKLANFSVSLPRFCGKESEVEGMYKEFKESLGKKTAPIVGKLDEIKKILENCQTRYQGLAKGCENTEIKLRNIEKLSEEIEKKVQAVNENDEKILTRIRDIIELQQNIKKPLTHEEKSLAFKLSELENRSNLVRINMEKVVKNIGENQDKLRSLTKRMTSDQNVMQVLSSIDFQLGDISEELNKFKKLQKIRR